MGLLGFVFSARLLCLSLLLLQLNAEPGEDKQALLDFLSSVPHYHSLNWDQNTSVCTSWTGVTCNADQSRVIALRLPAVGFRGPIPPNTLGRLTALQILSLRRNRFLNPLPSDFTNLGNLTNLFLQSNRFSGPLPLNLYVWENLLVLNLSNNNFNGTIPDSISNLTHLITLDLSNNNLSGKIPDIDIPSLQSLNLSNNDLNGSIPPSLQRFPRSAFLGNNLSYGTARPPIQSIPPSSSQPGEKSRPKLSETALLGIIIAGCVVVFAAAAALMVVFCKNKEGNGEERYPAKSVTKDKSSSKKNAPHESQDESQKMTFFEESSLAFDLEDLLRASAEVLGKGTHGMTYKAALEDSTTVVVKRLKDISVGKREFEQQMEVVGNIKHENVAALTAYYYSKDEKLVVYDYFSQGSVSTLLHGNRGENNRVPLDWETRLKIAVGAAQGIAHIHTENNKKLVHGNIKSSNIFLNSQLHGCVSDIGFSSIVTTLTPPITRTAGYRAPEVTDSKKVSQASDVYSFGVFLLELLTGKSPLEEGTNLVKWVNSVVREEWTAEVFDVELLRYPNIEEDMVQMLQLALTCVIKIPDQRPKMWEVVRMLEGIRRGNTGTRQSSECSTPTPPSYVVEIGSTSAAL